MKKLLLAVLLFTATSGYAIETMRINRSSFTATSDKLQCIPGAQFLDSVVVGFASAGGSLTLYNSTWTNTPVISSVSMASIQTVYFNNISVAGLCYTINANTNGATIIYKK